MAPQAQENVYGDWEQVPVQEVSVDTTGGVYSNVEPYFLKENQLAYLKNATLDKQGVRRKRYGCSSIGAPGTLPQGLTSWIDSQQDRYMAAVYDGKLSRTIGDGAWALHASAVSLMPNVCYDLTQVQYLEYHGPPTSTTILHSALAVWGTHPYSGVTLPHLWFAAEDGDATIQASYSPRALTWWQGRMWMGNLSEPDFKPTTLIWSTILDAGNISNNNTIEIDQESGDEIMALIPARGTNPRLYIFKRKSVWALDVVWSGGAYIPSTENSLDTTGSRLVLVSEKIGCVAPRTIVYSSGSEASDIFFLASDGYRSIRRVEQDQAGGAGLAISEPIKDVIDRINWAAVQHANAVVFDHKVFLSLPVDGSTYNNVTVIFDLISKEWVGEYDWTVHDSSVFNFSGYDSRLYLQWRHVTTEDVLGSGATSGAHIFYALDSTTHLDPSNAAVEYEEQSRAFVFGNYGQKKRWDWVELMLEPAQTTATLTFYGKVDEYEWHLIDQGAYSPRYEYPVLPAQLPWLFEETQPQTERFGLMDFPPGQRLQFKIVTDSPSAFGVRVLRTSAWPIQEQWE